MNKYILNWNVWWLELRMRTPTRWLIDGFDEVDPAKHTSASVGS